MKSDISSKPPDHFARIRAAQVADAEVLTAIRYEAIIALATATMGRQAAEDWANAAAPDRVKQAIENHQVYAAELTEQCVAWVEFNNNRIEGLYVQPGQAMQGVGSALLAYAEGQILAAGFSSVTLEASWNAEPFYIKRGYQPVGERSPELGRPMVKFLTPKTAAH